jgi:hypothetical protein
MARTGHPLVAHRMLVYALLIATMSAGQVLAECIDYREESYLTGGVDTQGIAYGVAVAGPYAYLADGAGMRVVNIADPASPVLLGWLQLTGITNGIAVSGSYAYIADVQSRLYVANVSNPSSPFVVGSVTTPGWAKDVAISGTHAYVADGPNGLQVVDITNPHAPFIIGSIDTPGQALRVTLSGSYAYIADGPFGLQIIDITDPSAPRVVGSVDTPDHALGVAVSGSIAYVADGNSGLCVVNVASPTSPILMGRIDTSGYAYGVTALGSYVYVADGSNGVLVVETTDPSVPMLVGLVDTPGTSYCITQDGAHVYSADGTAGIQIAPLQCETGPMPVLTDYVSFDGDTLTLFAWEGGQSVLQSRTANLNHAVVGKILDATDSAYRYYQATTGYTPPLGKYYHGKTTISDVESTCGAGCGYLGWTGIELQNTHFDRLYTRVRDADEFDQVVFYEFGRNFWHLGPKIEYVAGDSIGTVTTGFAVFMRFMSMDAAGVDGGPFGSWTFADFRHRVEEMVDLYAGDPTQTWDNTLRVGHPQANNPSGLGAADLFASFVFRLARDHGGAEFIQDVWKRCAERPDKVTTQDALDNFILASCAASRTNLTDLFTVQWRWPMSDSARAHAALWNVDSGVEVIDGDRIGLIGGSPNPFSSSTLLRYRLPRAESVLLEVYNAAGQRMWAHGPEAMGAGAQATMWDGTDREGKPVAPGVYYVRLCGNGEVWTQRLVFIK